MGFPHQTVSGLVGTSYWGDPLNVGGSNTVNIFGARRRTANCTWLKFPSHSLINHLVKGVTCTPSLTTQQLVTPHLLESNTRFHINTFALSIPSLSSLSKQLDLSQVYSIFHTHLRSQKPLPQGLLYHQWKKQSSWRFGRIYWSWRGTSNLLWRQTRHSRDLGIKLWYRR